MNASTLQKRLGNWSVSQPCALANCTPQAAPCDHNLRQAHLLPLLREMKLSEPSLLVKTVLVFPNRGARPQASRFDQEAPQWFRNHGAQKNSHNS